MPDNIVDTLRVQVEGDARAASGDIDKLVGDLTKLKTALEPLQKMKLGSFFTPSVARNAEAFANAVNTIDLAKLKELSTLNLSNIKEAFGGTKGLSASVSALSEQIEALSARLSKFAVTQNKIPTATAKATAALKQQTRAANSHHKSFSLANTALGKFFNSVKRIAFYRVIRSAIKAVTQGFSEGIQNMYFWSQAVGTSFAPAMDRLATATLYLKNGFASMWSPLIERAIPIIDHVIDKLVDFFNFVQEGFARLTGASTWTKALKYPVQFAENTEGATKAAKALQNVLMGFDELNVINTPNDSGRGAAGDEKDYSAMFQVMQTDMLDDRNWGQRLADKVNEFVSGVDWNQKGRELSDKINKLVQPIHDFLAGTNFENIGTSISDFLDGAIRDIDASLLGDTLLLVFTSAFDTVGGLIKGLADKHTGKELGKKIKEFITTILEGLGKWVKETDFLGLLDNLVTITSDVIEGLDVTDILDSIEYVLSHIIFRLPGIILKSIKDSNTMPFKILFRAMGWDEGAEWIENNIDKPTDEFIKSIDNQMKEWEEGYEEGYQNQKKMKKSLKETKTAYKEATKELNNLSNIQYVFTSEGIETELGRIREGLTTTGSSVNSFTSATERNLGDTMPRAFRSFAENSGLALNKITANTDASALAQRTDWSSVDSALKTSKDAYDKTSQDIADRHGYIGNSSSNMAKAHAEAQRKMRIEANNTATTTENASSRVSKANSSISSSTKNAANSVQNSLAGIQSAYNGLTFPKKTMTIEVLYQTLNSPEVVFGNGLDLTEAGIVGGRSGLNTIKALIEKAPKKFATGGFTPKAELFYAGENGIPEIMGKVNGRSAVVGGDEITGIADAIYAQGEREEQLLATLISVVQAKDFSFVPNAASGRLINQALRQYAGVTG